MRPVVHGLEQEYNGRTRVVVLDYDVREDLRKAQALNANYHPALVFLRPDGSVLRLIIGYMSPERIRRNVEELLSS
jgi:hypothetical protein